MNAEEQLDNLRQQPKPSKEENRRKIMTAIVLTMSTLIAILFLVYAFIQKLEADKQREISEMNMTIAKEAQAVAEQQRIEAVKQLTALQQELDNCKKGK